MAIIDNSSLEPCCYGTKRFRSVLKKITGEEVQALKLGNSDSEQALKTIKEAV